MSRPVVLLRAGAVAHGGLAPRGLGRHAGGRLALATAVRMVARVHHHAAHLGPPAHVPRSDRPCRCSGSRGRGCPPGRPWPCSACRPGAPRRRAGAPGRCRPPWPGAGPRRPRSGRSGRPCRAPARCCGAGCRAGPTTAAGRCRRAPRPSGRRPRCHPTLRPLRHEDVALLAVRVVEQADARRAVRVVLDRGERGGHVPLVALEVDAPVVALLAAAAMAHGHAALVVATAPPLLGLEQRLVGRVGGDLLEGRAGHEPPTGGGRLVASQRHRLDPLEEFDLVAWTGRSRRPSSRARCSPGRGRACGCGSSPWPSWWRR